MFAWIALLGCSSAATPTHEPRTTQVPADAAIDAVDIAHLVADAAPWIFRYTTPQRSETWTLRYRNGLAAVTVESAQGVVQYKGIATEGESIVLDVSTGTAKLTLRCKENHMQLGATCGAKHVSPTAVLECYHPDFKQPMPFGSKAGVEYVETAACKGYRAMPPSS